MRKFEQTGEYTYMFGFEESYGCLIGTHARDKDGIAAVMALCEAAAYYKEKGYTLWEQMINIYEKYGYYKEYTVSITREGASGAEEIKQMMEKMRNNPPKALGKYRVLEFRDYKLDVIKNNLLSAISLFQTSALEVPSCPALDKPTSQVSGVDNVPSINFLIASVDFGWHKLAKSTNL